MKRNGLSFLFGALFAVGLALSGMMSTHKVMAFLDVAGDWDPSLAFVMIGAIGVYLPLQLLIRRRERPILAPAFVMPEKTKIDAPLLLGAATFGVGWGAIGFCPAPALASLAAGSWQALVFVGGMLVGLVAYELVLSVRSALRSGSAAA